MPGWEGKGVVSVLLRSVEREEVMRAKQVGANRWRDFAGPLRPLPLLTALLAAGVVGGVALLRGQPFPGEVAGVLLVIGATATVISRGRPSLGALLVAVLAAIVAVVLYGG